MGSQYTTHINTIRYFTSDSDRIGPSMVVFSRATMCDLRTQNGTHTYRTKLTNQNQPNATNLLHDRQREGCGLGVGLGGTLVVVFQQSQIDGYRKKLAKRPNLPPVTVSVANSYSATVKPALLWAVIRTMYQEAASRSSTTKLLPGFTLFDTWFQSMWSLWQGGCC